MEGRAGAQTNGLRRPLPRSRHVAEAVDEHREESLLVGVGEAQLVGAPLGLAALDAQDGYDIFIEYMSRASVDDGRVVSIVDTAPSPDLTHTFGY